MQCQLYSSILQRPALVLQLELGGRIEGGETNPRKKQSHDPAGNQRRGRSRSAVGRMPG
jgi:hypothetical protein